MIEVKNVSKKYGNYVAVDNISFEVNDNEIVGFLGPNGAGKTTTMNMITGYIEPTSGRIIVDGFDVMKNPRKAKRQIGYMPENVPMYKDLTVKEFINYMAELKGLKVKEKIAYKYSDSCQFYDNRKVDEKSKRYGKIITKNEFVNHLHGREYSDEFKGQVTVTVQDDLIISIGEVLVP